MCDNCKCRNKKNDTIIKVTEGLKEKIIKNFDYVIKMNDVIKFVKLFNYLRKERDVLKKRVDENSCLLQNVQTILKISSDDLIIINYGLTRDSFIKQEKKLLRNHEKLIRAIAQINEKMDKSTETDVHGLYKNILENIKSLEKFKNCLLAFSYNNESWINYGIVFNEKGGSMFKSLLMYDGREKQTFESFIKHLIKDLEQKMAHAPKRYSFNDDYFVNLMKSFTVTFGDLSHPTSIVGGINPQSIAGDISINANKSTSPHKTLFSSDFVIKIPSIIQPSNQELGGSVQPFITSIDVAKPL